MGQTLQSLIQSTCFFSFSQCQGGAHANAFEVFCSSSTSWTSSLLSREWLRKADLSMALSAIRTYTFIFHGFKNCKCFKYLQIFKHLAMANPVAHYCIGPFIKHITRLSGGSVASTRHRMPPLGFDCPPKRNTSWLPLWGTDQVVQL